MSNFIQIELSKENNAEVRSQLISAQMSYLYNSMRTKTPRSSIVELLDDPFVGNRPVSPRVPFSLLLGLFLGLFTVVIFILAEAISRNRK